MEAEADGYCFVLWNWVDKNSVFGNLIIGAQQKRNEVAVARPQLIQQRVNFKYNFFK